MPPFCSMFCLVQCVWSIATAGKCPRAQRPTGHSCTLCSMSVAGLVMPPQLCTKPPQVLVPTNVDHQGGVAPRRATRRLVPLVLFHNQIDVLPWPSVAHVCSPSCPVAYLSTPYVAVLCPPAPDKKDFCQRASMTHHHLLSRAIEQTRSSLRGGLCGARACRLPGGFGRPALCPPPNPLRFMPRQLVLLELPL